MKKVQKVLLFLGIIVLGAFLRLYGLNWDQSQHLHPDERFLTQVTNDTKWPSSITEYFDTDKSPLNPHNANYGFFVYGTFPIFLVKLVAELLGKANYTDITLVGRAMSAIVDTGTMILVFFITKKLLDPDRKSFGIWHLAFGIEHVTMFLYALMPLPIQLSHFYATDPYLTFFLTLTLLLLIRFPESKKFRFRESVVLGIVFGLAIASKITALLFAPVIGLAFIGWMIRDKKVVHSILFGLVFILFSYLAVRLAQPYLFINGNPFDISLNPKILSNWKELSNFNRPDAAFPPALQWINTTPYLYPILNLTFLGLGLPIAIIALSGIIYSVIHAKKHPIVILLLAWIVLLVGYQGIQFAKAMRYFSPVYPVLAVLGGVGLASVISGINKFSRHSFYILHFTFYISLIIPPLMFLSVYSRPHTRISASQWICDHIPAGSKLATEHWDDGLPLNLSSTCNPSRYQYVEMPLYHPDSSEKWELITKKLGEADYILLTSNRLYGSILTVSERYPQTTQYYQQLFDGSLGFTKVAELTSRPTIPIPGIHWCIDLPWFTYGSIARQSQECTEEGITLVDDYVDETWTVYDHPKVIIFKRTVLDNTIVQ